MGVLIRAGIAVAVVGGAIGLYSQNHEPATFPPPDWSATVDQPVVGAEELTGTVTNGTTNGCTEAHVNVHLLDKNGAWVAGTLVRVSVDAGQTVHWRDKARSSGYIFEQPVGANIVSATAEDVSCADVH